METSVWNEPVVWTQVDEERQDYQSFKIKDNDEWEDQLVSIRQHGYILTAY